MSERVCRACRWWGVKEDGRDWWDPREAFGAHDPDTLECTDPVGAFNQCGRIAFAERKPPELHGAVVLDGEDFWARLITGPDFGCTLWETKP